MRANKEVDSNLLFTEELPVIGRVPMGKFI